MSIDNTTPNSYKKPLLIWIFGTCLLIWFMIMLGGATRLTHSGLSIVEWKPIIGIIPPRSEFCWLMEFEQYKQFPEYKLINMNMTLAEFKFIYMMEYFHRLLGRIIGLFFVIPLIYFWLKGAISTPLKKKIFIILLIGLFQGFMGWYMVKSGLSKEPSVSHYRLTAHLLLAFILLGILFWTGLSLQSPITGNKKEISPYNTCTMITAHLTATSLLMTIIYGGFVAGLKAGKIYNTFPLMEGQFLPGEWDFYTPIYINFLENPATVQWTHRYLALATLCLVCLTVFKTIKNPNASDKTKSTSKLLLAATFLQVLLGVLTLLYEVPVSLGTLHQGLGALVFTILIYLLFCMKKDKYTSGDLK